MKTSFKFTISSLVASALMSSTVFGIEPQISTSGLIEVEIASIESDSNGDSSDAVVSTFEYAIEAALSEAVSMNVLLLAEDIGDAGGEAPIDEATIELIHGSGRLTVGQLYIPFGAFNSDFVSDPLTLELAEANESAVMYGFSFTDQASVAVYFFNGEVDDGEDELNDFGVSPALENEHLQTRIDYLSNLSDSDLLGELGDNVEDDIAGLAKSGR